MFVVECYVINPSSHVYTYMYRENTLRGESVVDVALDNRNMQKKVLSPAQKT